MFSINTNLQSLIAQNSLKNSTNKLNQAIERMTTGFKINGAKDNAANYAITTNMTTQIGAYEVAEENVSMGLDLLTTANDSLDIINDRLARLRALSEQAANGTYGEQSLKAINEECNALVDEINRLYLTTEYNGTRLFIQTGTDGMKQVLSAKESTTFKELGIGASSFSVYDKSGSLVESYDTEETDTIGDLFDVLKSKGFNCSISNGTITLNSADDLYIAGNLADELGITTTSATYTASSSQTSSGAVTYTEVIPATEATTLKEIGVNSSSIISVKDEKGILAGSFTVNTTDTIRGLFSSLSAYGITGNINNGVISFTSADGKYAEGTALTTIGVTTQNGNVIAVTHSVTSTTTVSEVYTGVNRAVTVTNQKTGAEKVFTLAQNATFADLGNSLKSNSITMSLTNGVISLTASDSALVAKGAVLDSLGISTKNGGTYTITTGNTMTSAHAVKYTVTTESTYTTTTVLEPTAGFAKEVQRIDTSGLMSVSEAADSYQWPEEPGTYAIRTVEDLYSMIFGSLWGDEENSSMREGYTYILANDIDLREWYELIGEDYWAPIGNSRNPFKGTFDGNGYTISNLKFDNFEDVNVDFDIYMGLFSHCEGATIKNLGVENIQITNTTGMSYIGGLAASCVDCRIDNCYVTGNITSEGEDAFSTGIGGLVGYMDNSTIINSSSDVNISATAAYSGGLVGVGFGNINKCYSTGSMSGYVAGGLIGILTNSSDITDCYHTTGLISSLIEDGALLGGLIGGVAGTADNNITVNIKNCYSTSDIVSNVKNASSDNSIIGGLIAATQNANVSISNSYVTGNISASTGGYYGGIVGDLMEYSYISTENTYLLASSNILTGICAGYQEASSAVNIVSIYCNPDLVSNYTDIRITDCTITDLTSGPFTYNPLQIDTHTTTTSTTSTLAVSTKLSELGINNSSTISGNGFQFAVNGSMTVQEFINALKTNANITATLNNGLLTLAQTSSYITSDAGGVLAKLGINAANSYTATTKTLLTNTDSNQLNRTESYTTKVNTTSNNLNSSTLKTMGTATTFADLGYKSGVNITLTSDGTKSTINMSKDSTVSDFITALQAKGITAGVNNGILTLSGDGITNISNRIFNLATPTYTTANKSVNTKSDKMQYEVTLDDLVGGDIYAPGEFTLQVGIYADENSRITVQTAFLLPSIDDLRNIGLGTDDYMSQIDEMIQTITARQTEYGAAQNRLESALEEISTHYENLVSSRSTLRDTDVAQVSSDYIKQQILQQASATLLATANQTPALALQLL
ncbi:MAG: hypothetical protein NC408_06930 [Candidatus Gastranaerophilales bacterium]|nr:hypothetical protein [Candidatus Gastranaerophilales bacterium]MCM1072948.1 hypothetical protein [Bacteroides sp.]